MALALATAASTAQVQIDKRRPAASAGEVSIENPFGSVRVIGWEKDEVAVTGTLSSLAEGLDLSGDKHSVSVDVEVPDSWSHGPEDDTDYRSTLEIRVPKGSSLQIQTINASITVEGVEGGVDLETTNGSISVAGSPREVEISTITGGVEVGAAAAIRVESISGAVTVTGGGKMISASTVSGSVTVTGRECERVELQSTSGNIRFDGNFVGEGAFEAETFSGNVDLALPSNVAARFRMKTFSGPIENEIGPRARRKEQFSPYQELRFTTGLNDFDVDVKTYSGKISLRVSPAAAPSGPPPPKKDRSE